MIQIEIDKFKIKINTGNEIQVFPLNVIGYLIDNDSELVRFYDVHNKMIVINVLFKNLLINSTETTRDNINDLLKDLFFINYYTKEEADELLDAKADKSDTYTKSEVDELLDDKADKSEVDTKLNTKQDTLVSGINIKTINGTSILGSGNILIEGGGGVVDTYTKGETDDLLYSTKNDCIRTMYSQLQGMASMLTDVTDTKLETKVDKETGKMLSSNDYTNDDKIKLDSLSNYNDSGITKAISDEVVRAMTAESALDTKIDTSTLTNGFGLDLYNNELSINVAIVATKGELKVKADKSNTYTKDEVYTKSEIEEKLSIKIEKPILVEIHQSGNTLTLTEDANQYTQLTDNTVSVILPSINYYTEIHLLFAGADASTLVFNGDVLWKEKIGTMKNAEVYELVFTYLNNINKWIAGYIKYE